VLHAGSALVSIATAAQAMLAQALFAETAESRARVNELVLHVGIGWGPPEETARNGELVGRRVTELMTGASQGQSLHVEW
jgi:hypothetical protein